MCSTPLQLGEIVTQEDEPIPEAELRNVLQELVETSIGEPNCKMYPDCNELRQTFQANTLATADGTLSSLAETRPNEGI